jgi:hypothetical protein
VTEFAGGRQGNVARFRGTPSRARLHLPRPVLIVAAVRQARDEAARFFRDPAALDLWSRDFFRQISHRVVAM